MFKNLFVFHFPVCFLLLQKILWPYALLTAFILCGPVDDAEGITDFLDSHSKFASVGFIFVCLCINDLV